MRGPRLPGPHSYAGWLLGWTTQSADEVDDGGIEVPWLHPTAIQNENAPYQAQSNDLVLVNCEGGSDVYIYPPEHAVDRVWGVKVVSNAGSMSGAGRALVFPDGPVDLEYGEYAIDTPREVAVFVSDGAQWWRVS